MICLDSYKVPVKTLFASRYAYLSSAWVGDLPSDWDFDWNEIRSKSDIECQCIVKLTLDGQCLGLTRFGLYYSENPTFVEIEQLESHPTSRGKLNTRLAKPVGMWLIWYAIKTALKYCKPLEGQPFVILSAFEEALEYYRDKVGMEFVEAVSISPDEEGYVLCFSLCQAKIFCKWLEERNGTPTM